MRLIHFWHRNCGQQRAAAAGQLFGMFSFLWNKPLVVFFYIYLHSAATTVLCALCGYALCVERMNFGRTLEWESAVGARISKNLWWLYLRVRHFYSVSQFE